MTPFAKKVYKAVSAIPIGEVRTYKWAAKKAGNPNASRAVGPILKNNPFPLIIPCHRVIRKSGALGGYHWGSARKRAMLAWEAAREAREAGS